MQTENLLGIAGGAALGFFGSKLLAKSAIPADIEAEAAKIVAFDDFSQVFLHRKPLYAYIHQGQTAALYAWTITVGDGSAEKDNPQALMSVTPQGDGTSNYEFGGHGHTVSIYHNGVFKHTVPESTGFRA